MERTRSFHPLYTRIIVQLCSRRKGSGKGVNIYMSRTLQVRSEVMGYIDATKHICAAFDSPVPRLVELETDFQVALKKAAADLPQGPGIDIDGLRTRAKVYRDLRRDALETRYIGKVMVRVALEDFRQYPRLVQRDLLLYLGRKDQAARRRLCGRGLRWKGYERGNAPSLFRKPIQLVTMGQTPMESETP